MEESKDINCEPNDNAQECLEEHNASIAENLELVLSHSPYKARTAKVLMPVVWDAAEVEFRSLVADAVRYRLLRAISIEPDGPKRAAMWDACDAVISEQFYPDIENATNEQYDAFADHLIAVAHANR